MGQEKASQGGGEGGQHRTFCRSTVEWPSPPHLALGVMGRERRRWGPRRRSRWRCGSSRRKGGPRRRPRRWSWHRRTRLATLPLASRPSPERRATTGGRPGVQRRFFLFLFFRWGGGLLVLELAEKRGGVGIDPWPRNQVAGMGEHAAVQRILRAA